MSSRWIAIVRADLRYAAQSIGYWIRPYDMLADRRRWRWQPPTCCWCGRPAYRWTHPRVAR